MKLRYQSAVFSIEELIKDDNANNASAAYNCKTTLNVGVRNS